MATKDARSLPSHVQRSIREHSIKLFSKGATQISIAAKLGVTRQAVGKWVKAYKTGGEAAIKAKPQGRPKGGSLEPWQSAQVVKIIRNYYPNDLGMPFFLWTREAVSMLIFQKTGLTLSKWTVGRYLRKWGFSSQKPMRQAIEQNPNAIKNWLKYTYPAIKRQSRCEKGEILWADEMGLRSDHQTGKTYSIKGKTPVVKRTGKRFGCNMISAISNQGTLRFMVFRKSFTGDLFIGFLRRLGRQRTKKVFLIVDQHPVHKSKKVKDWLTKHESKVKLFFLPSYCPELNPDELLNNDTKSQAFSKRRPRSQDEMLNSVISHLRMRQKQPHIVMRFVKRIHTSYAS